MSSRSQWVIQIARDLTGSDGFLENTTPLILDRDTCFPPLLSFLKKQAEIEPVLLPPKSPNTSAHLERFMISLKSECLNKLIFFGEHSLERALREYVARYHPEWNHQGLDDRLIESGDKVGV